jgi:hypothetical protein
VTLSLLPPTPKPPVFHLPDGRRVYSSLDVARAISMRSDNMLTAAERMIRVGIAEQVAACVPGEYTDTANRPHRMFWFGEQALAGLAATMTAVSGAAFRAHVDQWRSELIVGGMPTFKLRRPLRAAKKPKAAKQPAAALAAPVATAPDTSAELLRELRATMSGWGLSPSAQQSYVAAMFRERGVTLPEPTVQPLLSTTEIAERLRLPVPALANWHGFQQLKVPEHGEFRLTVAPTSKKQVPQWLWNRAGLDAIERLVWQGNGHA